MSGLEIRLLGRPEIRVNGAALSGLPAKLEALVYYLAISPRSVPRSTLAGLLWSDRSAQDARMNLRAALQKIPAALEPHIVVTREWLALDRNRELDVDVQRFDQAVGALSAVADGPARRLERLTEVASLYRDEFLSGFASGNAPEFEAWCNGERTRLRQGAVRLLGETLRLRREAGRDDDVAEDARRILHLAPGHDAALRELMEALARAGQRNAAVEEYERHRKRWHQELGISPSEDTVRLAERIVAGESFGAAAAPAAPPPSAQLIGRERDFALVARLLTSGEARIVSITGLGGVGKSRLAQAAMAEIKASFGDGTAFFSVGAMRSGAALAPAMAANFGLTMQGRGTSVKALQDYLREKSMLLVFDSFEGVLGTEAVDLLLELAESSPGVRCLVTSRESLGVSGEVVVAIEGLAFPGDVHAEDWRDAPAVQLFIQRAMRGYVQFDAERERAGIVRICQSAEGIPLAIELAAALARTLPCVEVARAIEKDLGALSRDDAGLSPRHRSLVGVLACAFGQLTPELQAALARLSIFRGPFSAGAAEQVAGTTLRQLSALIEKSWLRRDPHTGYSLHDMIRRFAAGQRAATGADAKDLAKRHGSFFIGLIAGRRDSLQLGEGAAGLDEIQSMMGDLLEGCDWGLTRAPDGEMALALEGLYRYYENRGDYQSVANFFGPAVEKLEKRRGARRVALARALCSLGWAQVQLAQLDDCGPTLARAVELARAAGEGRIHAEAQRGIALGKILQGKPGDVAVLLDECIAISREEGDEVLEVGTHIMMGVAGSYLGTGRGQHDHYQRAIEIARRLDYPRALMVASFNLGDAQLAAGELDAAERGFSDSLVYGRKSGNKRHITMALANLAAIALKRGDEAGSRRMVDEAYGFARVLGDRRLYSFLFQAYAELEVEARDWRRAGEWVDRMVATAGEIGWDWSVGFGLALRAQVRTMLGDAAGAQVAIEEMYRRMKDTDFGVHHANVALEACRWMRRFAPGAHIADAIVRALAGPLVVDDWITGRAQAVVAEGSVPAGAAFEGDAHAAMEVAMEAFRQACQNRA